jgi:hypothetical protein
VGFLVVDILLFAVHVDAYLSRNTRFRGDLHPECSSDTRFPQEQAVSAYRRFCCRVSVVIIVATVFLICHSRGGCRARLCRGIITEFPIFCFLSSRLLRDVLARINPV